MSLIQPVPSWIIETSRWEIQIKFIQHKDETALIKFAHAFTQALTTLYDRYIKRIYRYCYQRTSNTHDAEDLAAQTFITALEALAHYRQDDHFVAGLFTITRNKIVGYSRRIPGFPLNEAIMPISCCLKKILAALKPPNLTSLEKMVGIN